jgi:hypothetical protein
MNWPWSKPKLEPYNPGSPDGIWSQQNYDAPRPQAPVNNYRPDKLVKTLETVPSGERREVFDSLTGPGTFEIFRNNTPISVEINEIFIFGIAAGNVTILQNGQAQTPIIPMAVAQNYSDSGFRLEINGAVSLLLSAGTKVSGFLRWRYT